MLLHGHLTFAKPAKISHSIFANVQAISRFAMVRMASGNPSYLYSLPFLRVHWAPGKYTCKYFEGHIEFVDFFPKRSQRWTTKPPPEGAEKEKWNKKNNSRIPCHLWETWRRKASWMKIRWNKSVPRQMKHPKRTSWSILSFAIQPSKVCKLGYTIRIDLVRGLQVKSDVILCTFTLTINVIYPFIIFANVWW